MSWNRSLEDSATATDDTILLETTWARSFEDSATATDSILILGERRLEDSAIISDDTIQDYVAADYFLEAYLGVIGIEKTVEKSLLDSSITSDDASINTSWNRSLEDSATATDSILILSEISLEDSATASDSGTITLLNYIDLTYFSEDYVGEVTNIT